ncbi:MAG TPA: hypothetical protein VF993_03060 [Myxococcales bacterium]
MAKAANKVVLVIEDNPIDQKMMVRAFGKWSPRNEIAVARMGSKRSTICWARAVKNGRSPRWSCSV